jgi:protein-S-isoprenylcysteine O-methyltransferase Ste14
MNSIARYVLGIGSLLLYTVGFFLVAGSWDWTRGWIYLGLMTASHLLQAVYLRRKNPEMCRSRRRVGKGTKKWDIFLLTVFMILFLSVMYVAAWDFRTGREAGMPDWVWPAAAVLFLVFMGMGTWAMAVNPHFEKTVRIQSDRDHRVVDSGPYRYVRHPGYVAAALGYIIPVPFLLDSWNAMIPAGLAVAWFFVRTALEDRTLRRELEGYEEYARRVRYRLVPLVW